jgi:hypothetical protein
VNQEIDGADQRRGGAGDGVDGMLVADVGGEGVGVAAGGANGGGGFVELGRLARHQDDASAAPGELGRQRPAEAAAGAGHESGCSR